MTVINQCVLIQAASSFSVESYIPFQLRVFDFEVNDIARQFVDHVGESIAVSKLIIFLELHGIWFSFPPPYYERI